MSDIVERLEKEAASWSGGGFVAEMRVADLREAAAEIERLRAALEPFAAMAAYFRPISNRPNQDSDPVYSVETKETGWLDLKVIDFRRARAALHHKGEEGHLNNLPRKA